MESRGSVTLFTHGTLLRGLCRSPVSPSHAERRALFDGLCCVCVSVIRKEMKLNASARCQTSPTSSNGERCSANTIAPGEASNMLRQTVWEAKPFSTNGLGGQTGPARPHWAVGPADRLRRMRANGHAPQTFLRILLPTVCYAKPLAQTVCRIQQFDGTV